MLKAVGVFLVVTTGFLIGNAFSLKLAKRADIMLFYANASRRIGREITYFAAPLDDILNSCVKENGVFCVKNLSILPRQKNSINKSETQTVESFFSALGKSDTAGQQKLCEAYSQRFSELYAAAKEECNQKCKIYRVLGLFGGIATAIILV